MRRLADALIDPIRVSLPADPEELFAALVTSVNQWRGREVVVHKAAFPPHTATGLWLERDTHDDVIIEERAAVWHQIVIFGHEVWHMSQGDAAPPHQPDVSHRARPAAARTDFSLRAEQEADRFGMLVGRRLRALLEASDHSVFSSGADSADDVASRIGAALNYRGTRR
ncbi:toxin [Streptomyces rhizosphaerihabitans]|uniref:toxin n=1 Tax=Streptomyces rhizosphaerihabitans TaxID=1266770 RepID=UPI0021C0FFA7|nr:toxin [Streptomyces rhizosphaerihabitans]MCT9009510.1 toxin [Streptomyces rhizosphaerihabitans]